MAFTLYIVATPIGNMEDITYRAVRILKEVPLVLAEDTRHTRILFDNFEISTPMEAYHDFNKEAVTPKYVNYLKEQGDIALVSDAGTPGIADPAFNLVRECVREGIDVRAVPGPCAMVTALVSSGMPTDHFAFQYFSPKKSAQRLHLLEKLKDEEATQIFYASPQNVDKFVDEIRTVFGDISLDLSHDISTHIGRLGIDTASHTGKKGLCGGTHTKGKHRCCDRNKSVGIKLIEHNKPDGNIEQSQANNSQSHHSTRAEGNLQTGIQALASRIGSSGRGIGSGFHTEESGQSGKETTRQESKRHPWVLYVQDIGHESKQQTEHGKHNADNLILLFEIGHSTFTHIKSNLLHAGSAFIRLHHPGKEIIRHTQCNN